MVREALRTCIGLSAIVLSCSVVVDVIEQVSVTHSVVGVETVGLSNVVETDVVQTVLLD